MMPPSYSLPAAIVEAIEAHATHYAKGAMAADKVLAALIDVTSSYLADIADDQVRTLHQRAFLNAVTITTEAKRLERKAEAQPTQ